MAIKQLPKISNSQKTANGVSALANRPNLPLQYGQSGLSAEQLKAWFDKLSLLLADTINEISDIFANKDEAASCIRLALDEYSVETFADLIEAFKNGTFANNICKVTNPFVPDNTVATIQSVFGAVGNKFTAVEGKIEADIKSAIDALKANELSNLGYEISIANSISQISRELAEQARSIAKGANKSLSYKDYAEMMRNVRDMTEDARLNIGQNIYIAALNVPDLWVREWYDNNFEYNLTAEEFERQIKENGFAWCGHYILSALETQKVDLTDYYTKEQVDQIKQDAVNEAAIYVEEWF